MEILHIGQLFPWEGQEREAELHLPDVGDTAHCLMAKLRCYGESSGQGKREMG